MEYDQVMETMCEYLKELAAEKAEAEAESGAAVLSSAEDMLFTAIEEFTESLSFEIMQCLVNDKNKDFVRARQMRALATQ